jgi:hypothetical protein
MNESQKYCRSLHAPISLGTTSDDRFLPNGYLKVFSDMPDLILTEKLDGQNNAFTKYGLYARSHTAPTVHPWDKPLLDRWKLIKDDLGDIEIFGENMYGIHSIGYSKLESYYYVFAIRDRGVWLSWDEVKLYAELFDFPTVPEIEISFKLKDFYKDGIDENKHLERWLELNIGMTWENYVDTPGILGGYDPLNNNTCCEGFVIRNSSSYRTNDGILQVANNEFNNLFKIVRGSHVKTDIHWTKSWKPAILTDYNKYKWYSVNIYKR